MLTLIKLALMLIMSFFPTCCLSPPSLTFLLMRRRIRERGYRGLIIGMVGANVASEIDHFKSCGANHVMHKPVNMALLQVSE